MLVNNQNNSDIKTFCLFQLPVNEWILINSFILEMHKISKFHTKFSIHKDTINCVNFRILTKVSRRQ